MSYELTTSSSTTRPLHYSTSRVRSPTAPHRVLRQQVVMVPGYTRLTGEMEIVEYRNVVTIGRDRVEALIKDVVVARIGPTLDVVATTA